MWPFSNNNYQAIVEKKREERTRLLSTAPKFDPAKHTEFLKAGAKEIVSRIQSGEWTAIEVVEAYIARATAAHVQTNCGTEILFEQALKQAKQLDTEYASSKQLRGPFHGVPISLKDQYDVAGFDTTIGFTQWANNPAQKNAAIVQQLISLGAIPIIKTNVPQTMFSFECNNPLWGRTLNPYNDKYTCGGSSGGEAALLALDGAVFGVGSDVGGSLRIPTTYCGVYALKPTVGRISRSGSRGPTRGDTGIQYTIGPMGRTVEELDMFCRGIFGFPDGHEDYTLTPTPYREAELPKKMRFGYYTSDGFSKASPANQRAVTETVEALKKQGHECIELTDFTFATGATAIFLGLTSSDGYRKLTSHLGPDPMEKSIWLPVYGSRVPGILRVIVTWVVESILGDTTFGAVLRAARIKSFGEWSNFSVKRNEFIQEFYDKVWRQHNLDGLIAPVQSMPQMPHGGVAELNALASSTILYNLVDSPVGVLPVTFVDPSKDALTKEWTDCGPDEGSIMIHKRIYKDQKPYYDPVAMKGMPVGIQLVGKRFEDEKVLAMMEVVDNALGKKRGFGPVSLLGKDTPK
ncbi:amidase signature enzyme [Marasmius fiardii PR-910]|nr:amidase signature enzyme [Marasmius fiardii PR-910]